MSLTPRDRKIILVLAVVALPLIYWFLLLSPKRAEESKLQSQLTQARSTEQVAAQKLAGLNQAKRSYASDYQTVIELGKSIPSTLDISSLLWQLNTASGGNGIVFASVTSGARSSAPGAASSTPGTAAPPGAAPTTPTSPASTAPAGATSGVPGLDSVPISFEFDGTFFDLADFFHQVKRFVQVSDNRVLVSGRLMTINDLDFQLPPTSKSSGAGSPELQAKVSATVYLAPKSQGLTAGAGPAGPAVGSPTPTPASGSGSSGSGSGSASPAAAVIAR